MTITQWEKAIERANSKLFKLLGSCVKHKLYLAVRKPRGRCRQCWKLFRASEAVNKLHKLNTSISDT